MYLPETLKASWFFHYGGVLCRGGTIG